MNDFSIILTIALGLAAVFSPALVAVANNLFNLKIRKNEQENEQKIKAMELEQRLKEMQIDTYYVNKKNAFSDFTESMGTMLFGSIYSSELVNITSLANKAILFCSNENKNLIKNYLSYLNKYKSDTDHLLDDRIEYTAKITEIASKLNEELMEAMPDNSYQNVGNK